MSWVRTPEWYIQRYRTDLERFFNRGGGDSTIYPVFEAAVTATVFGKRAQWVESKRRWIIRFGEHYIYKGLKVEPWMVDLSMGTALLLTVKQATKTLLLRTGYTLMGVIGLYSARILLFGGTTDLFPHTGRGHLGLQMSSIQYLFGDQFDPEG